MRVWKNHWMVILAFVSLLRFFQSTCLGQNPEASAREQSIVGNESPIVLGTSLRIESKILDESRRLNIYLPPSYASESERKYPVIYLLDGAIDEDYHHQTGIVQFMSTYQLMPESIVVGIANTDRKRDLTHPTSDAAEKTDYPTSGGSAKFIQFLGEELQPLINQKYRVANERTLIGQSLGGLLATEVLLKKPELFENYVIVSPSLYWSQQELVSQVAPFLQDNPHLDKKIFLALGKEHPLMQETMNRFVAALSANAPANLKWDYVPFPDETHATIMHRATYRAYEFLYRDKYKGM